MDIKLEWPLDPSTPISGTYSSTHKAVDFACVMDTPTKATADGEVVKKGDRNDGGFALFIKLQHDGFTSIYAHLNSTSLNVGDKVKAGDIIGYSGNTGNSTGPHLHFETRKGKDNHDYDAQFDPMPYLLGNAPAETPAEAGAGLKPGKFRLREYMNVRTTPMLADNALNKSGSVVEAAEIIEAEGITWGKIAGPVYIAIEEPGKVYADKVE